MNKYFLVLLLVFYSFLGAVTSQPTERQVEIYAHNTESQRRAFWHLLSQVRFEGNEKILDVGSGDGRNTAWIAWLIKRGNIIGIDPADLMISWARKQYAASNYPNLSFEKGDANHLPKGPFDVITAFLSLEHVAEKRDAFQGFYNHLVDNGYVLAVINPISEEDEFQEAIAETMADPRWKTFFKSKDDSDLDDSNLEYYDLQGYIKLFQDAGFSICHAEFVPLVETFVNRNEAINGLWGSWSLFLNFPEELQKQFFGELVDRYIKKRPSAYSKDGVVSFDWGHYEIVAQKLPKYSEEKKDRQPCSILKK